MARFAEATRDLPGERSPATVRPPCAIRAPDTPDSPAYVASDWVRAGIALYGSAPDYPEHGIDHWQLQPSMTLAAKS